MALKRRLQFGRGRAQVEMDSTIHDMVSAAIENLAPGVLERLEQEAESLYEHARKEWPVNDRKPPRARPERSRDALRWAVRLPKADMSVIESTVFFDPSKPAVEYAHLVKGRKHRGKQSWRVVLQKPAQERASKLGEDLRDVLTRVLEQRR